ncbi:MAG: HAMP domain-containing sensor histidine kinase [Chloroflexota bacterium]
MLRPLRVKLTLLYFVFALGLVILLGAGSYVLLSYYFQQSTDLALQYKMATEFRALGLTLPQNLAQSEQVWLQNNPRPTFTPTAVPSSVLITPKPQSSSGGESSSGDGEIDNELLPIFVNPLDANGQNIANPKTSTTTKIIDISASAAAMKNGVDLRTITMNNGTHVRLLTYPTGLNAPAVLQVGRQLTDQDRVLSQYLTGLVILGSIASLMFALISWWLAGRSLSPAQKAFDQQQNFVSNASHELRTPLTLIRATAELGLRAHPSQEQGQTLQDIVAESDYMNHLVDDLLLLSRLDAHRLQLAREVIPVSELVAETVRQMEKLGQEKGISLTADTTKGNILGDRARVRQVLLILLDNALRFTPPNGAIRLSAKPVGKLIELVVSDNGSGIPPEHLAHLFERFYQVRTNATNDSRSNGLGLSIAKALVEAQSGNIRIESAPGKGTHVYLLLPVA